MLLSRAPSLQLSPGAACATLSVAETNDDGLSEVLDPTPEQLRKLALARGLPFIGFGFLDNFIMILSGDAINATICIAFGFSTMAAAAIGNTISDVIGVYSGGIIEDTAEKMGFRAPPLSHEQFQLGVVTFYGNVGQCVGIVIGCILGMCPLLWLDVKEAERKKKEQKREGLLADVIHEVAGLLKADSTTLLIKEESGLTRCLLWHEELGVLTFESDLSARPVCQEVYETGHFLNVEDVRDTDWYDPRLHDKESGARMDIRSVLAMPIFGDDAQVLGVLAVQNKKTGEGFSYKDEDILSAITSHVSAALGDQDRTFQNIIAVCHQSMTKTGTTVGAVKRQRSENLFKGVFNEVKTMLQVETCSLMLVDRDRGELIEKVCSGLQEVDTTKPGVSEFRSPMGQGVMGHVAATGEIIHIHDMKSSSFYDPNRHVGYHGSDIVVRNLLCVPIHDTSNNVVGVLECVNKQGDRGFQDEDLELVLQIANNVAFTLEGSGSRLKKALQLVEQQKAVRQRSPLLNFSSGKSQSTLGDVICHVNRAQNLPKSDIELDSVPFVTCAIVNGNPYTQRGPKAGAKVVPPPTRTVMKPGRNPSYLESLHLEMPQDATEDDDLYVHVQLWDNANKRKPDELIGGLAFPLQEAFLKSQPQGFQLKDSDGRALPRAQLWLSFEHKPFEPSEPERKKTSTAKKLLTGMLRSMSVVSVNELEKKKGLGKLQRTRSDGEF